MSKCFECKYEHADCKGDKRIEKAKCDYFSKKDAINYPQKVRELEKVINGLELQLNLGGELCEVFRNEINRLNATLKQADEAYDLQGKQLLEALDEIEKLKEENVDLRFESVRAFERGQKFPCNLDCDKCTEKCRAWQRGFDATCERESGNCDVLKGMKVIAEVVSNTL